mgnify:CR=1 FL=1
MKIVNDAIEIVKSKTNNPEYTEYFLDDIYYEMSEREIRISNKWDIDTWIAFILDYVDFCESNTNVIDENNEIDYQTLVVNNGKFTEKYNSYFKSV